MKENEDISIREAIKVLTLFFILSVVSMVMIYSKFEQGVEDFWENREEYKNTVLDSEIFDLIDLDNVKTADGVSDFDAEAKVNEYIESGGEEQVFSSFFDTLWQK